MKIAKTYSHLNGEEYLIVHHPELYEEIKAAISSIDAESFRTKVSEEKTKAGKLLYAPKELNKQFKSLLNNKGWKESVYKYHITNKREFIDELLQLPYQKQSEYLQDREEPILYSYKQTDFVKDKIAIEVQFGKYAFVAFDLFVKHLLFYSGNVINLGIEILPTKKMSNEMSSGVAYYEGEVYNVMRSGRGNPPVPLLIIGIEQED